MIIKTKTQGPCSSKTREVNCGGGFESYMPGLHGYGKRGFSVK